MAIEIPTNFESPEEKLAWLQNEMLKLTQASADPAVEADRLRLVSALEAHRAEHDIAPPSVVVPDYTDLGGKPLSAVADIPTPE